MLDQWQNDPSLDPACGGLCLYLLGPPIITFNRQPIIIARKQVRLLLYYLAARDQFVSYEHLQFLFWPDTVDSVSHIYLVRLLNHLNKSIEIPGLLMRNETHIQLDRRQYWSDLRNFRALISESETSSSYANQLEAVKLYRAPFLEGVQLNTYQEFENIIENLRTGLEQRYLTSLESVITMQTDAGELQTAIELCQVYLQADDLNENIHRQLMQLYARSGNRKLAIKQFQRCSQILQENLGLKPMMETQDLYLAVLEGRIEMLQNNSANPPPMISNLPVLPFLGRVEVFEKFIQAFGKASLGQGNVLLINGAGGKGKTRLLQEFRHQVDSQSLCILIDGHPVAGAIHYFSLLKILRYIQNLDTEAVQVNEQLLETAKQISNQINRASTPVVATKVDSGQPLPFDLWEQATELILQLASRDRPLVLMFDDLHLIDPGTLDWLSYFADQIEDKHCLLVGSICCMELSSLGNLRSQLLNMGQAFQEYQLQGLVKSVVYQAVKHIFGNVSGCRTLADQLWEITAGNPRFLQEILRGIFESGYLPQDLLQKDHWPLPENVWRAVELRLARLKPLPRRIVENAAYMEQVFYFEQLSELLRVPEMELLEALEDLACRGILVECNPGYSFQHPLIRLALRRTTSRTRQALIKRRMLQMKTQQVAGAASR